MDPTNTFGNSKLTKILTKLGSSKLICTVSYFWNSYDKDLCWIESKLEQQQREQLGRIRRNQAVGTIRSQINRWPPEVRTYLENLVCARFRMLQRDIDV